MQVGEGVQEEKVLKNLTRGSGGETPGRRSHGCLRAKRPAQPLKKIYNFEGKI